MALSYALFLFLSLVFSHALSSSFDFIKPLQGSKKGDKVIGLYNLKKHLKRFGYIDELAYNNSSPEADYFSDQLDSAVRTYQTNFNLKSTGVLDAETVSHMMKPRCGVADIINGRNWTRPNYAFFPGSPKWPNGKNVLTYAWADGTPSKFFNPTHKAFNKWFGWTRFKFQITDYKSADLKFHLYAREHGDWQAFDGHGGVLAHAQPPIDGECHFDSEENWEEIVGSSPYDLDIQTVAMHQIGHLLGLAHSGVSNAVMYPFIDYGEKKRNLANDDIEGIKALYP